jgi:hypothetical protein
LAGGTHTQAQLAVSIVLIILIAGTGCTPKPLPKTVMFTGVVLAQDTDPRKQFPVRNAQITATWGGSTAATTSDNTGLFRFNLVEPLPPDRPAPNQEPPAMPVTLKLQHPDYQPLQRTETAGDHLYIARMIPLAHAQRESAPNRPEILISNPRVRYTTKVTTTQNVGSVSPAFEVVNTGNVPCNGATPCSPDGKWKASRRTMDLDAAETNEFRNVRVSCIAGPCPFTRNESNIPAEPGQHLKVSVLNWSDTTTFLIEAEVVHTMISNLVRISYPVVFGDAMNFALPSDAEGPSILADLGGSEILFPLGPDLILSWADCTTKVAPDHTTQYRCEVKPGYRYQQPKS